MYVVTFHVVTLPERPLVLAYHELPLFSTILEDISASAAVPLEKVMMVMADFYWSINHIKEAIEVSPSKSVGQTLHGAILSVSQRL